MSRECRASRRQYYRMPSSQQQQGRHPLGHGRAGRREGRATVGEVIISAAACGASTGDTAGVGESNSAASRTPSCTGIMELETNNALECALRRRNSPSYKTGQLDCWHVRSSIAWR